MDEQEEVNKPHLLLITCCSVLGMLAGSYSSASLTPFVPSAVWNQHQAGSRTPQLNTVYVFSFHRCEIFLPRFLPLVLAFARIC